MTAEVAADRLFMPLGFDRWHWQPKGRRCAGAAVLAGPGAVVGAGPAALLSGVAGAASLPNLRKWASACPTPGGDAWPVIDLRSSSSATLVAKPFTVSVHPDPPPTTVWGYTDRPTEARSTYLGPTILARRGSPVDVTYRNELPSPSAGTCSSSATPSGTPPACRPSST